MTKSNGMRPGTNSGKTGSICQEVGPKGGPKNNYATIPENTTVPPTSKRGGIWVPIKKTPHGTR